MDSDSHELSQTFLPHKFIKRAFNPSNQGLNVQGYLWKHMKMKNFYFFGAYKKEYYLSFMVGQAFFFFQYPDNLCYFYVCVYILSSLISV